MQRGARRLLGRTGPGSAGPRGPGRRSRHHEDRRAQVRHGQLGARRHQGPRPGRQGGLHARGRAVRRQRRRRRGADGRCGRRHRRGLAVRLAPAHRRRAADLHPLFEQRRCGDGAGRQRRRRASPISRARRSASPAARSTRAGCCSRPTPGRRTGMDLATRRRAGLRRAAAADREAQERRARRRARTTGTSAPGWRRRATGGWSASARCRRRWACRLSVPQLGYVFQEAWADATCRAGPGVLACLAGGQGDHARPAMPSGSG